LSYVIIGAALSESINLAILAWTILAFIGGMVIAAHYIDLLNGDPLKQKIPRWQLRLGATFGLSMAVSIGFWQILYGPVSPWLLVAIPIGCILALGYGLEWPLLHGNWQFSMWWAVFPVLIGYLAQDVAFTEKLIPIMLFAFATAYAQRELSTRVRFLRRKIILATVILTTYSGESRSLPEKADKSWLLQPLEMALAIFAAAMVLLAIGLLLLN